jgi:hypothetical protein
LAESPRKCDDRLFFKVIGELGLKLKVQFMAFRSKTWSRNNRTYFSSV